MEGCSVAKAPFHAAFVNGIVGTFGLASAAVNAFVGDDDGHVVVVTFAQRYRPAHG